MPVGDVVGGKVVLLRTHFFCLSNLVVCIYLGD